MNRGGVAGKPKDERYMQHTVGHEQAYASQYHYWVRTTGAGRMGGGGDVG